MRICLINPVSSPVMILMVEDVIQLRVFSVECSLHHITERKGMRVVGLTQLMIPTRDYSLSFYS